MGTSWTMSFDFAIKSLYDGMDLAVLSEVFARNLTFQNFFTLFCLYIFCKLFGILSWPEVPRLVYVKEDNEKLVELIGRCKILHEKYVPAMFGGRNGHYQTASYGVLGRVYHLALTNIRYYMTLKDGTTSTFDVYEPLSKSIKGDVTLAICPGIANSSESAYIRTLVNYAQKAGYRCAVLNHLGTLRNVILTTPRIFTYGGTDEYRNMVLMLGDLYPNTQFITLGFSMGGNIVTKYLGEGPVLPERTICGISVCQGYNVNRLVPLMMQLQGLRRFYCYIMTENVKHLLRDHYDTAVAPHVKSGKVDEQLLWSATSMKTVDECYTRHVWGFSSLEDFYEWGSSSKVMDNIKLPMLYLNALDDPLVPPSLLGPAKAVAMQNKNTLYVETKHGGHLGFLEGGAPPHEVTWLDRFIVEFADAAVQTYYKPL